MFKSIVKEPIHRSRVLRRIVGYDRGTMEQTADSAQSAKRILFIDDDPFITDVVGAKLREAHFEVHIAKNGQAGLEMLATMTPDLILLDLVMPNVNGFAVLERLRASEAWRGIPVIVFSNLGEAEELARTSELGVREHIVKSTLAPHEVVQKVTDILGADTV